MPQDVPEFKNRRNYVIDLGPKLLRDGPELKNRSIMLYDLGLRLPQDVPSLKIEAKMETKNNSFFIRV